MISKYVLKNIDMNRDAFWFDFDRDQIIWRSYNPNSNEGGCFVVSYVSFDLVMEAKELTGDDYEWFFDVLLCRCTEYCYDITDEYADFDDLAEKFMSDYDIVYTQEKWCMDALVAAVESAWHGGVYPKKKRGLDR